MNGTIESGAVVLVDTNVIIEAHRTGAWAALVGGYSVETVEECVTADRVPPATPGEMDRPW